MIEGAEMETSEAARPMGLADRYVPRARGEEDKMTKRLLVPTESYRDWQRFL